MQKLTFLIDSMEARAGMERVTATVASGLAERGLDVEILTLRGQRSGFPLHEGVKLTSLHFAFDNLQMRALTLPLMRAIRSHARRRRPDVFITVDTFLSAFAFPALLGLPVRRVAWEHFHFHFDYDMRSRRLAHRAAPFLSHDVAVLTEADAQQWRRAVPRGRARLHVMPNPLPFPRPEDNPYSPDNRTVLAVGRLNEQKGFDLLLGAWAALEADFPEWCLKIVGTGPEEGRLRGQVKRLGLTRVSLTEPTSQVEREYRSAGLYVLSSRYEGLPMVLIESQAYGVPAVAFDCPLGPAEILAPGGGLLAPPGDVGRLTEALRRALGDPDLRRHMSKRAHEGARRYDGPTILAQWVQVLTLDSRGGFGAAPSAGTEVLRP